MTLQRLAGICLALALVGCADDTLHLAGAVERRALELGAPISEVIVELPLPVGSKVAAGEIVVQLDTEVAAAELRAGEAGLAAAQAALTEAEGEFTRTEDLRRSRVAAPQALDSARRRRDEALAVVAEREARLAQARKHLEDLTIRSHAAGVLDQLPFEEGERVPAGGVVAVVLAEQKPWLRVWVPARAVARLRPGAAANVRVEGIDATLSGRLEHVAGEPEYTPHYALTERESAHLVFEARVILDDAPAELRPGVSAWVDVRLGDEPASR